MALLGSDTLAKGEETNIYISAVSTILPQGWTVTSKTNAVPYNLSIQPGKPKGTCLTFEGTKVVKGPRGINPEKESFRLWIMPPDYVPVTPETVAQFAEAQLLGTNSAMALYWTTFTTGTPTWHQWQEDIIRKLEIRKAQPTSGGDGKPAPHK